MLIANDIESVQFLFGETVAFFDLANRIVKDPDQSIHNVYVTYEMDGKATFVTEPDQIPSLSGSVENYALGRGVSGSISILDKQDSGRVVLEIAHDSAPSGVIFGDGKFVSTGDFTLVLDPGRFSLTFGSSNNDILLAGARDIQYLSGLEGYDIAYIHGNIHDYGIRPADVDASRTHPAISGYELVAINGSGNLFIDRSVEYVHFQNGLVLSYNDLTSFIAGA